MSRSIIKGSWLKVRIHIVFGRPGVKVHMCIEKETEISKNNAMLIRNLLEISHGKRVTIY
jgi:hypothetical protein